MGKAIDVGHLGRDRVICAYDVDGVIVDPGPASCVDSLLEGLGGEPPRALFLTHIHLDHAGASGVLVRRYPDLPVYVHEYGAPHLADPSRLVASVEKLYGGDMDRLWGEVAPVPKANLRVLEPGEVVEGFRVAYAPGHAIHHVAYLHEATGNAYVGDVAGVRIPPATLTVPPTPPPDIDLEAWRDSLDTLEAWRPAALCLTHFGAVTDVEDHLLRVRERLTRRAELARAHGEEAFVAATAEEVRLAGEESGDEGVTERFIQAAPLDQMWLGLERYWRTRAERETVESG